MTRWWRRIGGAALFLAGLAGDPTAALAQATVEVEVRDADGAPVDGTVTLEPRGEGETRHCETREGRCTLEGVAGGRHTVRFAPRAGEAPPARSVMIPPSGRVTLIVATGD